MLFILIYRKNIDRILQVHHPQSGVMDRNQAIGLVVGPCIAISVTLKYYKCALFILDQLRKLIGKIIIHKPVRLSRPDIIPVQIDVSHVLSGENHVPVINHIKSIYSLKPIGENLFKDFPALCIDNSEIRSEEHTS